MQADAANVAEVSKSTDSESSGTSTGRDSDKRSRADDTAASKDVWDKVEILSRIISAIAIPAAIAIGGWYIQNSSSHESISKDT